MKNTITKKQENDILELIGHFILTKPILAKNLLSKHGVKFSFNPSKIDLSNEYVELLSNNNDAFNKELTHLLNQHIEAKNDEIREIASADGEDEFWGAIAKLGVGLVKGIGSKLFGKKKKSPQTSSGGAASNMMAQMQMQQKMAQMEAARRAAEERRKQEKREADERRRREEAAKQKAGQSKMMMMAIGGMGLLAFGAYVMKNKNA